MLLKVNGPKRIVLLEMIFFGKNQIKTKSKKNYESGKTEDYYFSLTFCLQRLQSKYVHSGVKFELN